MKYNHFINKREAVVFKSFERKSYSLFACLRKEVLIGALSVATLTSAQAAEHSQATTEQDSLLLQLNKEFALDEVLVSATQAPLTSRQSARLVTVLEKKDIQSAPVQSVNDLLKYVSGIDVRQRGPMGVQTDVSIRGGSQEQIAILLNGVSICDPQTAHNTMDLPVDLSEIERIEIVEGSAGRVFGSSSMRGAINIITRVEPINSVAANVEAGSFGYVSTSARGSLQHQGLVNQISAGYRRSDGYSRTNEGRLNSDFSATRAFYQGRFDADNLSVKWHAGVMDKGWGSSTFYASPKWKADNQYEHTTKIITALYADASVGRLHFRPTLSWNRYFDRYEGIRHRADLMRFNYNRMDIYTLNMNAYVDWKLGRTAFGGEVKNEDHVSGNLGEPLKTPIPIHGTDREYTLGINRTNLSAFLEHNILLRNFTLSAGLVAVKNSWNEMKFQVYPGVDISYRPTRNWKLFASANSSLRMPSYTEMYYKITGYNANPQLKPEEMWAFNTGFSYSTPGIAVKMDLFHHRGSNMIDWIMNTDSNSVDYNVWKSVNHTSLRSWGANGAVKVDFQSLIPGHNFFKSLSFDYTYTYQDKKEEDFIVSQYALEYLRHKFVASLDMHLFKRMNLTAKYRWQDRVGQYIDFDGITHNYSAYGVLDARLSWDERNYQLYVEANNILNKSYRDYGLVKQPGFWVVAGAGVSF